MAGPNPLAEGLQGISSLGNAAFIDDLQIKSLGDVLSDTQQRGSQSLSPEDKEELVKGIKDDTYPIIEKLSKKLLMMLDIEDQVSMILKDLYFMNIIIDVYKDADMFGNSAAIGASIGMVRSISGIIKELPFSPLIAKLEQERILDAFRKLPNSEAKQSTDKRDDKRSDREPNDN